MIQVPLRFLCCPDRRHAWGSVGAWRSSSDCLALFMCPSMCPSMAQDAKACRTPPKGPFSSPLGLDSSKLVIANMPSSKIAERSCCSVTSFSPTAYECIGWQQNESYTMLSCALSLVFGAHLELTEGEMRHSQTREDVVSSCRGREKKA